MKILILHTAFIGDIILSTPLIKKIRAKFPESEIVYVTTPQGASILKNNPDLKEIITFDKKGKDKGIKGFIRILREIKSRKFDMAIVPHRFLKSALLPFLAGIKTRIGFSISSGNFLFTEKAEYAKEKHEVERLLNLVTYENFTNNKIELFPSTEDKSKIENIWKQFGLENINVIAVAPGSRWKTKMWPEEYFVELVEKLSKLEIENKKTGIVIIGGKEEENSKVGDIKASNVVNLAGKTTLLESAEVIRKCKILITNDSSPIHIASAFETYILAIFGATTKELGFYPWSKNSKIIENKELACRPCGLHGGNECPKGNFKCMIEIKPEILYNEVIKILKS